MKKEKITPYKTGDELLEAVKKLPKGTAFEALFNFPVQGNFELREEICH